MTRVVETVLDNYKEVVEYKKVNAAKMEGALRYKEFSAIIKRPVPIPSIIIDNKLVFASIPSVEELQLSINKSISNIKNERG